MVDAFLCSTFSFHKNMLLLMVYSFIILAINHKRSISNYNIILDIGFYCSQINSQPNAAFYKSHTQPIIQISCLLQLSVIFSNYISVFFFFLFVCQYKMSRFYFNPCWFVIFIMMAGRIINFYYPLPFSYRIRKWNS